MINNVKGFLKDFKDFAIKGNVIDMAVGIIIGGAFTPIVSSLVKDIIMPPIGAACGKVDFSNLYLPLDASYYFQGGFPSLKDAQAAGVVTINYGAFINTLISFIIVAFAVFLLVNAVNIAKKAAVKEAAAKEAAEPTEKTCPYCFSKINIKASRCPYCTSEQPMQ